MDSNKNKIKKQAQALLDSQCFVGDTETTGTSKSDEIVEIALIDIEGKVIIDSLIKPTNPIPAATVKFHGISNEIVSGAPSFQEIWETQLEGQLQSKNVCFYNSHFDVRMIEQSLTLNNLLPQINFKPFCLMKMYSEYLGVWNDYHTQYKWHKLSVAAENSGIPVGNLHRAMDDTVLSLKILRFMAKS